MLSPVSAGPTDIYRSQSNTGSAASSGGLINSFPTNKTVLSDRVDLSPEARELLAVSKELADFESRLNAFRASVHAGPGAYANVQGSVSTSVTGADSVTLSGTEFGGMTIVNEVVRGSATADDVMNVAVTNSDPANVIVQASVIAGDGNDTINAAATNAWLNVTAGNGNDTINVTTAGQSGFAVVRVGSGNDTISLNGSGAAYAGNGNDVVNLRYTGGFGGSAAINIHGGNAVINGSGPGTFAIAGRGTTTINNVDQAAVDGLAGATSTINLDNEAYSQIKIMAGMYLGTGVQYGGSATINLSDPAAGVRNDTQPYSYAARTCTYNNQGQMLSAVSADSDGNYAGDYSSYLDVLPTEGQDGYGLAHTRLDFVGVNASQVSSTLQGSTLTLTVDGTGQTVTVNNYQAGRVTFTFADSSDVMTASRQPPRLLQSAAA